MYKKVFTSVLKIQIKRKLLNKLKNTFFDIKHLTFICQTNLSAVIKNALKNWILIYSASSII